MTLHPFVAALLERQRAAGAPGLSAGSPEDARALVAAGRAGLGEGPDLLERREVAVPTRSGSVRSLLLVPHGGVTGVLVYVHGGGWVVGEPEDFETLGRELASRTGCAVLLPDYRLAPEHPFPAGLEDVEDVLAHVQSARVDLVGADLPWVAAGDSAGANLLTVALRRHRELECRLQVLVYPVTDTDTDGPTYTEFGTGLPLTRADMRWFLDHYLGQDDDLRHSPDVAPLRATDLAGLPPALVLTAEHDVLRGEGEAYAAALSAAGVPTQVERSPGVAHGFLRMHNLFDVAHGAVVRIAAAVGEVVPRSDHSGTPPPADT
ncbi:hypothetical protein ASG36_20155 [Geodermatophilus sp. Leaf369]|uniref:alpha/beta hydrolase n=1 Tax=Geodermatophilus sp. Leaf369 TaxID=1736354 RepID=UPI0006F947EF|nr:alpha/beta hydrolase [Geodermatophilus sp. Leaf369]KQS54765.1 hypothetical protein ASG36_20155 [Geodermatophilus sp. Leaf369]